MANGRNDWGVSYSRIVFLEKILNSHGNVATVIRDLDIHFSIKRIKQRDTLSVVCCDEYALGMTAVRRAQLEFNGINIIYVGGGWSGYTPDAKRYCIEHSIGLYNAKEISGGLWLDKFWSYAAKDEDGNKEYYYKHE